MTDGARFAVLKDSGLANLNIAGMSKVNLNNAGGKEQVVIGQLIVMMDGKNCLCSIINNSSKFFRETYVWCS